MPHRANGLDRALRAGGNQGSLGSRGQRQVRRPRDRGDDTGGQSFVIHRRSVEPGAETRIVATRPEPIAAFRPQWHDRRMNAAARTAIASVDGQANNGWPQRFDLAARQLLHRHLLALRPWLRRDVTRLDAEAIHDFRVTLRRLDSALRLLQPLASPAAMRARESIHRVFDALGKVRDLDEQLRLLEVEEPLHALLRRRRQAALSRLTRELRSTAAARWPDRLARLLRSPRCWRSRLALEPARAIAAALIRERRRRLRRSLRQLDRNAPLASFHRARRRAKRCDDALADFEPWLGDAVRPLRRALRDLRSALGTLQDAVVAANDFADLARSRSVGAALRERARQLSDAQLARRQRALRRALHAADAVVHTGAWRRLRKALGPPARLEQYHP